MTGVEEGPPAVAVVGLDDLTDLLAYAKRLRKREGWEDGYRGVGVIQRAATIVEEARAYGQGPDRPLVLIEAQSIISWLGFGEAARHLGDVLQALQNFHDGWVPCEECKGTASIGGKTGMAMDLSGPCKTCCPPGIGSNAARMRIHPLARPGWVLPPTGEAWTDTVRCPRSLHRSDHDSHTWTVRHPVPGVPEGVGRCPGWPLPETEDAMVAIADSETMTVAPVGNGPWCRDCGAEMGTEFSDEEVTYVCRTHGGMWSEDPRVIRNEVDVPHRPHRGTEPDVDKDGNPKPPDYEYQGRWYTHYLNHGRTWQAMAGTPPTPFDRALEAAEATAASLRTGDPDDTVVGLMDALERSIADAKRARDQAEGR